VVVHAARGGFTTLFGREVSHDLVTEEIKIYPFF